jgi:hypothetical protein
MVHFTCVDAVKLKHQVNQKFVGKTDEEVKKKIQEFSDQLDAGGWKVIRPKVIA